MILAELVDSADAHAAAYATMSPAAARAEMRANRFTRRTTRNVALGHVQCALVALPRTLAFDFLVFCQRNQRPCPVLEVLGPAPAPIARVRGRFRQRVLLKGRERRHLRAVALAILGAIDEGLGPARASLDVDPVNML